MQVEKQTCRSRLNIKYLLLVFKYQKEILLTITLEFDKIRINK